MYTIYTQTIGGDTIPLFLVADNQQSAHLRTTFFVSIALLRVIAHPPPHQKNGVCMHQSMYHKKVRPIRTP